MKHRIQMRAAASALAACICLSALPGALAAEPGRVKAPGRTEMEHGPVSTEFASTRLAFAVSDPVRNNDGTITLDVAYADSEGVRRERVTPTGMTETDVALITVADNPVAAGSTIELCYNEQGELINIKNIYSAYMSDLGTVYFDTMKYGAELSPVNGEPGAMLATGWLTAKSGNQITVGDLDLFDETYTLAPDVKVYEFNTDTSTLTARRLSDVPVTQKTDGEFYKTANRQQVMVVFDQNYRNADQAEVVELYYITPQPTIDEKYLYPADHMPIDSFMTENDGKTVAKPTAAAWLTATESFAIIPDRLYYVGDNEVAIYLTQADDGTLILLDAGWPASGYQYWRNIEAMGFDPRDIDYILLTHGHGDQYGTGAELDTMIKNAGGDPVVYECYEDTYGYDIYGFPEITGIIKDTPVLNAVDKFYINDTWMEFDGSVRIKPVLTAGHTNGTDSFIFELTDPATNETLTISYLGGYGVNGNTKYDPDDDPENRGYLRLSFQYGLRYLQQTVEPDYMIPQHTNQYPMLEINKAAEEKGIPFLEAVDRGSYEWVNFLEKRQAVITYEDYYQNWKADPKDEFGTEITVTDAELQTIEAAGPYRREGGTYQITLTDGGKIIQGFNRYMNQTDKLSGVENAQGQDVGDGIFILKDSFTHDPDAWYVQVGARVSDGYDGSCAGGPIESVHDNWFEILRTERLDSREEAEALLAQLQSGATYTVTLDQSSEIQLADNLTDTFQPAAGGTFTDVPATHWAAGAVAFVSSQGLLQGISADTFAPGQPMTRAMLVTALWREAGSPVVNYAMDFDDVAEGQWYTEAVRWAASEGIVAGTGKGFSPDAALTRESLAAILFRYAGGQADADQLDSYADGAGVSAWAKDAMNWAVAQGLITGKSGGRLDPGGTASRAEVSAILMRYVQSAQA
ncbi:MAG: S-layer homology domain-containing protein [Flavonifractor plautii]|nr:S-layer homology domain-containing protein [Flavonifractor plautii]MDU6289656.1 S-layer homology domain-containing protein [Flavonifractor plautii]MDU6342048.1 S-layer homology domain-containing protein [Flavonifractor plautii]